jgi:predicted dehydrogenase
MTDWGVHLLDYAVQGMKADNPISVSALGGKFAYPELAEETPDTLTALYEFDKFNLVWDSAMGIDNGSYDRNHGIAFIGNNGTLILDRQGWEVIEERQAKNKVVKPLEKVQDNGVELHWENFIAAIRNNKPDSLNCSIEEGAHIATVAQMGNIAFRSGKKISWNENNKKFTDDAIQAEYYMKQYNNGYKLPTL